LIDIGGKKIKNYETNPISSMILGVFLERLSAKSWISGAARFGNFWNHRCPNVFMISLRGAVEKFIQPEKPPTPRYRRLRVANCIALDMIRK